MCWFNPLRVKFLGCSPCSKGEDPLNSSFSGPFGAYQEVGLKILSNAKVKKPIDCSYEISEHSTATGGKLPLWLADSLRYLASWNSERSLFASYSCTEPVARMIMDCGL